MRAARTRHLLRLTPPPRRYDDVVQCKGGPAASCRHRHGLVEADADPNPVLAEPVLAALAASCQADPGISCNILAFHAPLGSEFQDIGLTCGGARESLEDDCADL